MEQKETADAQTTADSSQSALEKKRSRIPLYIVSGVLLFAAIAGLFYWIYTHQFETTDDAFIDGNIIQISPLITSHVTKIHVKDNQFVKKGDLLIELNTADFEAKVASANAQLRSAEAQKKKAEANVALTRITSKAGLNQAVSNYNTAKISIDQARISTGSKKNAITQAQNQVHTSEAAVKQIQSQIPAAEALVSQAKIQVPSAQTKLEVAGNEYERNLSLFNAGDVSKQTLEKSKADLSDAKSQFESTKKQVEINQSQLNSLHHQIEVANSRLNESRSTVLTAENELMQSKTQVDSVASQANESMGRVKEAESAPQKLAVDESEISEADALIAKAQAALTQAEIELSYTKIYAPDDGIVSQRSVQEGQLVQTEQALMAISQPGIWVTANFKETQIGSIKPGQSVLLYVDAFPNTIFNGTVESFQAGTGSRFSVFPPENASGNFVKVVQRIPIRIKLDESDDRLKMLVPGMSVTPKVKVR